MLVGGYIKIVNTKDNRWLILDEEGKNKHKPRNAEGTRLYQHGDHDAIVGDVVLCDLFFEFNGPEEDDDATEEG